MKSIALIGILVARNKLMTDVHSKETRSYNMSRIRSKDTKPEMLVRKYLYSIGFRYRLHDKKLPGTPDLVLTKYNAVIFVHGCFWCIGLPIDIAKVAVFLASEDAGWVTGERITVAGG